MEHTLKRVCILIQIPKSYDSNFLCTGEYTCQIALELSTRSNICVVVCPGALQGVKRLVHGLARVEGWVTDFTVMVELPLAAAAGSIVLNGSGLCLHRWRLKHVLQV